MLRFFYVSCSEGVLYDAPFLGWMTVRFCLRMFVAVWMMIVDNFVHAFLLLSCGMRRMGRDGYLVSAFYVYADLQRFRPYVEVRAFHRYMGADCKAVLCGLAFRSASLCFCTRLLLL